MATGGQSWIRPAIIPRMPHVFTPDLEAGLDHIRRSPADHGTVELIVRRPAVDEREALDEGELTREDGLVGDSWKARGNGSANPDKQLNVMNARAVALVARDEDRWPLAGDQLYVDLDMSVDNLPPGTRLAMGTAVIEVTDVPHRGCGKFSARFGVDALRFVNSEAGRHLRLRGLNARVVQEGTVRRGDTITKV